MFQSQILRSCIKPRTLNRAFSLTSLRQSQCASDMDLANKLKAEYKYEKEEMDPKTPDWLAEFQKKSVWSINDKVGDKEVSFVRDFGNEKITAFLSTDSLESDDSEFEDDVVDGGEDEVSGESPIAVRVLIEKKNGDEDFGALEIDTEIDGESFFVNNVNFSRSSADLKLDTSEGEYARVGKYGGPVFGDLDEEVQEGFSKYLAERGFDEEFASVIPQYLHHKEVKEYTRWLKSVSEFVSK